MDEVRMWQSSSLPDAQKAALRFTDAFLAHPQGLDAAARTRMLEHFDSARIVELMFKLVYWSCNKALIGLGIDGPVDPDSLTSFHYDEHGVFVLHRGEFAVIGEGN